MNALDVPDHELSAFIDEAMDLAKRHWASLNERRTYPLTNGKQTTELLSMPWADEGCGKEVLQDSKLIAELARPSSPRVFGYVVDSGEPVGAVAEVLAAALNQNVTSRRSAPAAATIERTVVSWLGDAVGCPAFRGSLSGGGSAANLMGLAMAREAKMASNENGAWPCVVYASEQVHMSIPKAVALLGIGRRKLRLIPTDDDF